jgi:hypothetical protein
MRDLHLWRLLQSRTLDPAEVTPLLTQLAELPLGQRVPFLGLLPLGHSDASLRKAAISVLAGCTGRPALQKLVLALNDAEAEVRLAAVEGLRQSLLGGDWLRWAHVLFHPDALVREAAIDPSREFPPPFLYKLYLLPDPVCRLIVEQQMATAEIDADGLPLLFDFLRRGVVTQEATRRLARKLSWNDWLGFLGDLVPRNHDLLDTLAEAMMPAWPEDLFSHYHPDRLDEILLLFWQPDSPDETESPHLRFFDLLQEAALAESAFFQQWLVFTMLGVAVQRQSWPQRAAALCAVLYPPFLNCPWVPEEVRRSALPAFYRAGQRCPRWQPATIRPLIQSDVCRRQLAPGEPLQLDLWAVAAVLHAIDSHPYENLLDFLPLTEIAQAFQRDLERSVPLLAVPDVSSRGRTLLLRELSLEHGRQRFHMLALLAQAVPSDALEMLDRLDSIGACGVLEELLRLEAGPVPAGLRPFSENKIHKLAILLARKIAAGQVERFFRVWLSSPAPQSSGLGPAILARLIHDYDSRLIHPALARQTPELLLRFLDAMPCCAGFPYDDEIRLAEHLISRPEDELRRWAMTRLRDHQALLLARAAEEQPVAPEQAAPVLRLGLVEQLLLTQGHGPAAPNVETCQALLASHDPPEQVIELFARYSSVQDDFIARLDAEMVKHWQGEERLPFLGHAFLYRWDRHLAALAALLDTDSTEPLPFPGRGVSAALRWALGLPSALLVRRVWQAGAAVLEHWRWHAREHLHAAWEQPLADVLVDAVRSPVGDVAVQIILHWRSNPGNLPQAALLEPMRQRLIVLMPGLSEEMRKQFAGWIDTSGLAPAPETEAVAESKGPTAVEETDLEVLAALTHSGDETIASHSARRMLELGEPGRQRLALAIEQRPDVRWPLHLLDVLSECPSVELRASLRRLAANPEAVAEVRFRIGQMLWQEGDDSIPLDMLDAVCRPGPVGWLRTTECEWLRYRVPLPTIELDLRLVQSPHPPAYVLGVVQLTHKPAEPRIVEALLAFLDAGSERMRAPRLQVARWLDDKGERTSVLPILLGEEPQSDPPQPALLVG